LGRAAHLVLALASAPLFIAFAWQSTIATVSDDSVSYLAMARWFAGSADAHLAPWLAWHSHFPPVFPILLALTGGSGDLLVAHIVVAALAAVSVFLVARYAALRLESDWGGFWVAAAFLALPTAWIGAKGILSEPLFLALSMGALLAHEKWLARGQGRASAYLAFGILVGLAHSTRAAGITLLAAFVVHEAMRAASTRRIPPARAALALLPAAAFVLAWAALRPGGHVYAHTIRSMARTWLEEPLRSARVTSEMLSGGWLATFVAEGDVSAPVRAALFALGAIALAGSVRAALRNRLDGWYVLLTAVMLFLWVFGVENMRRLLYPVVPLALLYAAEIVIACVRRLGVRKPRMAVAAICAAPMALCIPATALVAGKSLDREPLVPGSRYSAADMTDYYRLINRQDALALAAKHAATLAGLEALRTVTPPDARVMWMRPEYVALLGGREGVPYYYDWDARTLASKVRDARVDYLVVAGISKSDLAVRTGDVPAPLRHAQPYAQPAFALGNPFTGQDEFILLRVDRAALDAYLGDARR
jgi:4-amino-4-deoxy-L-arabinose transferase-like glycosyltransferase